MSCGAFGGSGNCGGGGGGGGGGGMGGVGMPGGFGAQRRYADRGFFDPFCMPMENRNNEPSCYFNPFVHAQCLGVDMNMQGFRNDILKCQEDYKKAVWAVLKKYAVGDNANKSNGNSNVNNSLSNHINNMIANMDTMNKNGNNFTGLSANSSKINMMDMLNPDVGGFFGGNPTNARRSKSSGFRFEDPLFSSRGVGAGGCGAFRNQLPPQIGRPM